MKSLSATLIMVSTLLSAGAYAESTKNISTVSLEKQIIQMNEQIEQQISQDIKFAVLTMKMPAAAPNNALMAKIPSQKIKQSESE